MRILILSYLKGSPITPTMAWAGIEHMTRNIALEFKRQGHDVILIAPVGSNLQDVRVIETNDYVAATELINSLNVDYVLDNNCWQIDSPIRQTLNKPTYSITHVMHAIGWSKNVIYLSRSQRDSHGSQLGRKLNNPVIRVPAPAVRVKGLPKKDYLLFIGIVSFHKGVHNAAKLATYLNRPLYVAGPAWGEYADELRKNPLVHFVGEVYGKEKWELIEQAYAVCCLTDGSQGFIEPGAGAVGEANALGTPVAALHNGCLSELVMFENGWIGRTVEEVADSMQSYYPPDITLMAKNDWAVENIVAQYLELFKSGEQWL